MTRVDLSDLRVNQVRAVSKRVCVARSEKGIWAFARSCVHEGADLALGYIDEAGRLRCPWHNLPYELESGEQPCESLRNLRVYRVREVEEGVYEIDEPPFAALFCDLDHAPGVSFDAEPSARRSHQSLIGNASWETWRPVVPCAARTGQYALRARTAPRARTVPPLRSVLNVRATPPFYAGATSARIRVGEYVLEEVLSHTPAVRNLSLDGDRTPDLSRAARAWVARRVPPDALRRAVGNGTPRPGDLVLARVRAIRSHTRLQLPDGRRRRLFVGDDVIVAYGNRYAPRQFEALVPKDLGPCHLVAGGGVAGNVLSRHDRVMRGPTDIVPLGLLTDAGGRTLNLADFALPYCVDEGRARPTTIAVVGTSMDSGKTTTAAYLARGLSVAGMRPAYAKVTGTGAGGDPWLLSDAGADPVLDFTDMGHASTYLVPLDELERVAASLVSHLELAGAGVVLLEVADGLFQGETAGLLRSERFRALVDGFLFAAGDAMGAAAGVDWLRRERLPVLGVSGALTAAPLARREAIDAASVPVLGKLELSDPLTATKLVEEARARRGAR